MPSLAGQMCAALAAHLNGGRALPPEAGRPLWAAFSDLTRTRSFHAAGPNPISYAEIRAWCDLMRVPLQPHHVQIIREMDAVWIKDFRDGFDRADGKKRLPPVSGHALTADLFDVICR